MIKNTKFNFLKLARFLTPFSALLSLIALIVIVVYGFSYGIDFAGGNEVQVRFKKEVLAKDIRQTLQKKGIKNPTVQKFGTNNEFLIRVEVFENEKENNEKLKLLTSTLKTQFKKQSPTISSCGFPLAHK